MGILAIFFSYSSPSRGIIRSSVQVYLILIGSCIITASISFGDNLVRVKIRKSWKIHNISLACDLNIFQKLKHISAGLTILWLHDILIIITGKKSSVSRTLCGCLLFDWFTTVFFSIISLLLWRLVSCHQTHHNNFCAFYLCSFISTSSKSWVTLLSSTNVKKKWNTPAYLL